MACSSGCPTPGSHSSWGECVRGKALQIADVTAHAFNGGIHRQINNYVDARKSGMQPAGVLAKDVDFARKMTDATGVPYRADA